MHGFRAPEASAREALRARLLESAPGVEIIEAYEEPSACVGAAALMSRAAVRGKGAVLLFVESTLLPDAGALRTLIDHALRGLAIAAAPVDERAHTPRSESPDFLSRLAAHAGRDAGAIARQPREAPMWAIERAAYEALGGLDPRFWSVGVVDDVAARAAIAGVPVIRMALAAAPTMPAYPLRPAVARLLAIRNPLLTAFKTAGPADLGEAFAVRATRTLLDSWAATGLGDDAFAFGGTWGRNTTAWQTVLQRVTGRTTLPVPLRDPEGCLVPLLAIDSFLDEIPSLLDEHEAWQRMAPARDHDDTVAEDAEAVTTTEPVEPAARSVSVIVVNWNGREHLRDCFGSLQRSDYRDGTMELICVDNGSTDGSVEFLRQEFPQVKVVALDRNTGFTGGNEAGVRAATGDVFVFLNNDMRVEPDCLRELVGAIDAECACAGARVLSWDGRTIDFVRGALNFEGRGFQDFYGMPNVPELATPTETFFPNGGAFAVTRAAYERAGGFDPTFFAYYDDVDVGWRLRLTGTSIRVAGRAVVYHRHGATSRTQPAGQKRFLMDRNAFWTLMKNYGDTALRRTLGTALLLAIRRVLDESTIDTRSALAQHLAPFVVRCRPRHQRVGDMSTSAPAVSASAVYEGTAGHAQQPPQPTTTVTPIRALPLEALGALCAAVEALPRIVAARAAVQQRRLVGDRDILPRFGRTMELVSPFSSYRLIQQALMEAQDLPELFRARTRLLIIGHEALARHISGPAVRVLEMGRALSAVARVTIATPGTTEIDDPRCTFAAYDPAEPSGLRRLAEDADVIVVQGFTLAKYPFLKALHTPVVVDLYCPFTLEHLEQSRAHLAASPGKTGAGADPHGERLAAVQRDAAGVLGVQNDQLIDGDFFICASEAQRDFWIGALHTQGRVNPLTYGDDPTLRRLIDVVPFGLPEMDLSEAVARAGNRPVMRGVWPGIGATDRILLWAGSLLDWQDPLTLIRAVAELSRTRGNLRLVFMGTRHPNPLVSPMQVIEESRALASQLGLLDRQVFFNDWVPYDQRALFLREADLGLSTHRDHLETHFSFRTRMLDYIWAGLPIVCTRGDFFAGLVETRGLGQTVPPGDVAALASAIAGLLDDDVRRAEVQRQLAQIRGELQWSRVVAPLARFCAQPHLAADHAPALRAYRQRLTEQYGGAKRLKRAALRLGLSEYQFERIKASKLGRTAMWLHTRRAMERAKRRS